MTLSASASKGKRIGLVDYSLDNFHADIFLKSIRELWAARAYEIAGAYALQAAPSREWAARNNVAFFDDLASLDAQVDGFMILAPSNPEVHFDLCARVFPFGKTAYVDKTFAPNVETAAAIFRLADEHGVAIQTSSALRYTEVQPAVRQIGNRLRHLAVWGGGTSIGEYAIHPVELVVSCLGDQVDNMAIFGGDDFVLLALQCADRRTATIHLNTKAHVPYRAAITSDSNTEFITIDDSRLFLNTTAGVLDFFDAGSALVDRAESLLVRRILDVVESPSNWGRIVTLRGAAVAPKIPAPKAILKKRTTMTDV